MTLVTMLLARGPALPQGDLNDRIRMTVTLTPQALLDGPAWEAGSQPWAVSRTRPGHTERASELVKIESGWAVRSVGGEDDPLSTLEINVVRPGELAVIRRPDGDEMIYRIVAVEPD